MFRHSACARIPGLIARAFLFLFSCCVLLSAQALERPPVPVPAPKPDEKDPAKAAAAADKSKGPEHNVSLMEEPAVNDLFNRAAKARVRAEKEPEAWPDCVKAYADILKKYPNTVYLEKWEGPDGKLTAYKNGLYKSTRERVAREIASLPPAALTVYRVINDPLAQKLYVEGHENFDQHKMEQLARDYFQTTWSNDALAWLGESAFERGAWHDASQWLTQAAANPGKTGTPVGLLARQVLANVREGDKFNAGKALEALTGALTDPAKGSLRLGSDEGPAALSKLKAKVEAMGAAEPTTEAIDGNQWRTYFGNAAHTQPAQARVGRGLRKWPMRIDDLLYGPNAVPADADRNMTTDDGVAASDSSINQQLTIRNGYFYINDGQVYAAYPVGNPVAGPLAAGGNAKYMLPAENVKNPPKRNKQNRNNAREMAELGIVGGQVGIAQHPYFSTLAGERAYGILGTEAPAQPLGNAARFARLGFRGGNGDDDKPKGPSNYMVCFGRADAAKETGILWSLKPGEASFISQSKADQEWLRSAYFVSSPTYEAGVLYVGAVVMTGTVDAWAAAFDAENGRLLWRTQICTAKPLTYSGSVQPDRGLPVAVANRTVYVVTNLGAVAALDTGGGGVKWIRVYDRTKTQPDQMFGSGEEISPATQFWAPNPPIVYQNRLLITPQDSDKLYVYDTETGARVWELARAGENSNVPAEGNYRHVLGVVNGAVVLTGSDILFMHLQSGKAMGEKIPLENPIKGRGALTANSVLVSTEKELLCIDFTIDGKNVKTAAPRAYKWSDPKVEAGSVYSAGGVLYTVSHTHVNAYILWEELEAKLQAQLKEKPDDYEARIELADVYRSIERFDQTLTELEQARQSAEKSKGVSKAQEALLAILGRKFDALMALGEKARAAGKTADAAERYNQAYEVSITPGAAESHPVLALTARAELMLAAGNPGDAAHAYQQIIAKHGNVAIVDQMRSSKMARLFAQMRLTELKASHPEAYAPIDAEAKVALAEAGNDAQKLKSVIARYPNSEHAGAALLALARLDLEKAPDRTRLHATGYLSRIRGGPDTAQALALLAVSCERMGLVSSAHNALLRLATGDELKDAKLALQSIDSKAPAGESSVREWAARRLEEPAYKRAPSEAIFAIGSSKLKHEPAWKQTVENSIPLTPDGIPPVEMRRAVFFVENQTELAAISGRDGQDLWKPRPTAPVGSHGRAFWWERLLIVCGENSISAYDSSENGKIAWSQNLKLESNTAGYWCQISGDRVILSHTGNSLQAFDAASGVPLWKSQLPGFSAVQPVCGDGYLLTTPANSNKLTAYSLDTGSPIWSADILELSNGGNANSNVKVAPVISGDRIFVAQRPMKLRVLDAKTGKLACDDATTKGNITGLRAAGGLAVVSLENHELAAYRAEGRTLREVWRPTFEDVTAMNISDFFVDGDDLLVVTVSSQPASQTKTMLSAYSIKTNGKLEWSTRIANDSLPSVRTQVQQQLQAQRMVNGVIVNGRGRLIIRNGQVIQFNDDEGAQNFTYASDGASGWVRENAARDHLLVMQSLWEQTNSQSKAAALIDRATGKSVWDVGLRSDQAVEGSVSPPPRIQLFDGGLVLNEGNKRKAFIALGGGDDSELNEITAQAAKNPGDADVHVRLAMALYDKGEREKALAELVTILSDSKAAESAFVSAYNQLALLRQDFLQQKRTELVFQRVEKAPDIAGGAAGWEGVPEMVFDGWRDVYLASEDPNARATPKKDTWRGADDLKATFKGAYDDKSLYIQIAVKDDVQHNEQADTGPIDFGDSLLLAFDVGLAGGEGYRGEAFKLALGLGKNGKAVGTRRVEHGRFTRGPSPLEKDFSVTRKEADRLTIYQVALPLDYLTLKPEAGTKFGFAFAVQDQDTGTAIDKSVCSSPGLIGSPKPKFFSHGVLEGKK